MRRITVPLPGGGGMVTDAAPHVLGLEQAVRIRDAVLDEALLKERRGWAQVDAGPGVEYAGVSYARFDLANVSRLVAHTDRVPLSAAIATGVHVYDVATHTIIETLGDRFSPVYYPRCIYNDELILCARDGLAPIRRYAGGDATTGSASGASLVAGESQVTAASGFSATGLGHFVSWGPGRPGVGLPAWPRLYFRASKAATTALTCEGFRSSVPFSGALSVTQRPTGLAYPAVPLPSEGTASSDGSTITGYGTKFTIGPQAWGAAIILRPDGGQAEHIGYPTTGVTDTSIPTILGTNFGSAKMPFTITSRLPFTDAQVHRGSLWGTGNYYYPQRVYVGPPGWRLGLPPGFIEPLDYGDTPQSYDPSEFTMFPIDVPGPGDDDPVVALLPTATAMLVLKRDSIHRIDGSYPVFSQRLVARGIGCIGLDAVVPSDRGGPYWADANGIYTFEGGVIRDLSSERIGRRWRQLTIDNNWTDVTLAVADDKLIVSVRDPSGTTAADDVVTFHYDIRRQVWLGELTNVYPARTWWDAANDRLLATVAYDGDGEIIDYAAMYRDSTAFPKFDDNFLGPELNYLSGTGLLANRQGIDNESILADGAFEFRVLDDGGTGRFDVTVHFVGGVETPSSPESITHSTSSIVELSRTTAASQRAEIPFNAHGRQHQVEITRKGAVMNDSDFAIGQIVLDAIDAPGSS